MTKIGIILINYKDYADKFLADCAKSLLQADYQDINVEFIVIDNMGDNKSKSFIKNTFPQAKYYSHAKNGFGVGNNYGIKKAIDLDCNYFYLLNMDTEVDPDFLSKALNIYQSDKKIGLVQSRLMLFDKKDIINSIGNSIHYLGFGFCNGYNQKFNKKSPKFEIAYPSGAGLLLSKEVFEKIGIFTEDFFMYHDDLEWGIKSRLYGYKNILASHSIVYHKYEFGRSITKYYYMERNRIIVWLMTLKIGTLILISPMFFLMELGLLMFSLINGWTGEKIKTWNWILKKENLQKIKKWRKETQEKRIISDRKLSKWFVSEIKFQEEQIENPILKYIANPIMAIYWYIIKQFIIW